MGGGHAPPAVHPARQLNIAVLTGHLYSTIQLLQTFGRPPAVGPDNSPIAPDPDVRRVPELGKRQVVWPVRHVVLRRQLAIPEASFDPGRVDMGNAHAQLQSRVADLFRERNTLGNEVEILPYPARVSSDRRVDPEEVDVGGRAVHLESGSLGLFEDCRRVLEPLPESPAQMQRAEGCFDDHDRFPE
jgi:hypothetical protein